jgi:ketosteroid isomerase-like protein
MDKRPIAQRPIDRRHATAADVVTELNRRFLAGDHDAAHRLLAPDVVIEQPSSLPHGGSHRGLDGMREMAACFAEHWTREIFAPRVVACGEVAVQVTSQTWTSRATGRSATIDVVELFAVADGVVREIRVFPQDTALLLATLAVS